MHWLTILKLRTFAFLYGPLASLIPLQALQNVLHILGYPAVTLFIMIESAGVPFPGETMLLLASFYSAIDHQLKLPIIIACAAAGAIVGDNGGYYVGRTGGRAFVERFGRYLFLRPKHLKRAEKYFAKHGDKTVFFGRFIAILRTWAAFLAGVNQMRWRSFLIYNAAGGIVWAILYGAIGYIAGSIFQNNFAAVERIARAISWIGAGLIIVVAIAIFFAVRWRRRRSASRAEDDEEQKNMETTTSELRDERQQQAAENTSSIKSEPAPSPAASGEHSQEHEQEER